MYTYSTLIVLTEWVSLDLHHSCGLGACNLPECGIVEPGFAEGIWQDCPCTVSLRLPS